MVRPEIREIQKRLLEREKLIRSEDFRADYKAKFIERNLKFWEGLSKKR